MILTVRSRTQPGWLIWLLVLLPFCFGTLNDSLGLPWAVRYLLDGAWLGLLVFCLLRSFRGVEGLVLWVGAFLMCTALGYLLRFQSPLYYLWGLRNNFRFYGAFFGFALFLTMEDVTSYLKTMDRLFWLNAAVSLVQYGFFGLEGDTLGGIFGCEKGVNAYTNLFFLIVTARAVLLFLEGWEGFAPCAARCGVALLIAALAELKFFFLAFGGILILAVLFTKHTWRKAVLLAAGIPAAAAAAAKLAKLYPDFSDWFSAQRMLETAFSLRGYTSSGDLNRLNAFSVISERWLPGWVDRLIGLGLGNCDTSGISLLNTPFFKTYGDMHYTWLSHAFLYLETGILGLTFWFGFFVLVYIRIRRMEAGAEGMAGTLCRLSRILALCCPVVAVYNASLRTEAAYMVYFILAIPFAIQNREGQRHDGTS